MTSMISEIRIEIESLHSFFVEWFTGNIPGDNAAYREQCRARFDDNMVLIPPGGQVLDVSEVDRMIVEAHGASPGFRIRIRNVQCRFQWHATDGHEYALATYEEWQRHARNSTPPDNGRLSTVLVRRDADTPGGFRWLHIHETWLPAKQMAAGPYDF